MPSAHSCICAEGREQNHSERRKSTEDTVLKNKVREFSFTYSRIRAEPNKITAIGIVYAEKKLPSWKKIGLFRPFFSPRGSESSEVGS